MGRYFILKMNINRLIGDVLKKLFVSRLSGLGTSNNEKFDSFDIEEISRSVEKLQKILKIDKKIECKFISERTIVIKSS